MCGRYALNANTQRLAARFNANPRQTSFEPRFNIAPSQQNPVVVLGGDGPELELMQWGLIPSWSKEPKASFSTINARVEGIEDKPTYRKPLRTQRCLVPATGFYEWTKAEGLAAKAAKTPYYVTLKAEEGEEEIFAMAGLYDVWRGADGKLVKSYTIITTEANDLIKSLHERMAVILPQDLEKVWLNPDLNKPEDLLPILKPYPPEMMAFHQVSAAVGNTGNDNPALIEEVRKLV